MTLILCGKRPPHKRHSGKPASAGGRRPACTGNCGGLASNQPKITYGASRLSDRKPTVPSRLQKWQTNQIFEAIQNVGLDPQGFYLENDDAEVSIKHKWSASHFTIVPDSSHYVGRCVVGDGMDWPIDQYTWQSLVRRIGSWLEDVKRDLEMPDLWAELQRDSELLFGPNSDAAAGNAHSTQAEQNEIASRLQALVEHVRRPYSLSATQMRLLEAKV